jgi:hypothetical protein
MVCGLHFMQQDLHVGAILTPLCDEFWERAKKVGASQADLHPSA